jgi:RNA-directed DNA polymerase
LGSTFRYDRDLKGREKRYLNVFPSRKAWKKEREQLRGMIYYKTSYIPLPEMITSLNRHLRGWANYFSFGYPTMAYRHINGYVRLRLMLASQTAQPATLPTATREKYVPASERDRSDLLER